MFLSGTILKISDEPVSLQQPDVKSSAGSDGHLHAKQRAKERC